MKTLVIIPAYNEAQGIGNLIEDVRAFGLDTLVIDDGSIDNTSHIAKDKGAIVLSNKRNLGKGTALRLGFEFALKNNYDAVITMDADGQHSPKDLPKFLAALNTQTAIVIGSRMESAQNMPLVRLLTNKFMSYLLSKACRQRIPDSQCGFRLINLRVLKEFNLSTSRYEIESEVLIRVSRLGYKILSVPIETIYRHTKSQINPFIDTLRFIRFMLRELWISKN